MGADQFACLLEHREDYSDEMFTQSDTRINSGFGDQNVVMKYGIYTVEDREVSVEQICDRALLAAQSIKGKYGRHFALYDDNLRGKLLRRQAITDCMETALDAGQFEVYLQPKYQIWDGWLAGAEALVRWNHPEWGRSRRLSSSPSLSATALSQNWTSMSGSRSALFCRSGIRKAIPLLAFRSMSHGWIFITQT